MGFLDDALTWMSNDHHATNLIYPSLPLIIQLFSTSSNYLFSMSPNGPNGFFSLAYVPFSCLHLASVSWYLQRMMAAEVVHALSQKVHSMTGSCKCLFPLTSVHELSKCAAHVPSVDLPCIYPPTQTQRSASYVCLLEDFPFSDIEIQGVINQQVHVGQ